MQEYDISLKVLLLGAVSLTIRELTGTAINTWVNIELPEVRSLRMDLLGEAEQGQLIHLEVQSTNDPKMPVRMAEYCVLVYRQFERLPRQLVLYVGDAPLQMGNGIRGDDLQFEGS